MIVSELFKELSDLDIDFYTGVPDSLLKNFISYISENIPSQNHIVAANEGSAIGLSIGYFLSTGKIPLVYMQNSGLGNAINPLLSLADKLVYSVPMILLIGWRGEPDIYDEPQHKKQGIVTLEILDAIGIPYIVIDNNSKISEIREIILNARKDRITVAIVVKKSTFEAYNDKVKPYNKYEISREEAIHSLVSKIKKETIIVSTTGMASRELFEIKRPDSDLDFLTVGGMGHAAQIALGIANQIKNREVVCIDGDGAAIMHLGSLVTIGTQKPNNFRHILLNNGVHGSVGNQPSNGHLIDFIGIAKAVGYENTSICYKKNLLNDAIYKTLNSNKLSFLEIKINTAYRKDLGRPTTKPEENKKSLMKRILD